VSGCGRCRYGLRALTAPFTPRGLEPNGVDVRKAGLVKLPNVTQKFDGFDRNPFLAAFQAGALTFLLINVHLYFGSEKGDASKRDMNRRSLEAYAVGRWADLRRKSPNAFTRNIVALGDFNIPKTAPRDPIYEAPLSR
jgi:hypothetical protein